MTRADVAALFAGGPPECIHDERYRQRHVTEPDGAHVTITRWCEDCGAELFTERLTKSPYMRTWISYTDPVYEMLYTRRGQLQLVVWLLEARGWPLPKPWSL